MIGNNRQVEVPLAHYKGLYVESDALEIAARTGLVYDAGGGRFEVTLVGKRYYVNHPEFRVWDGDEGNTNNAWIASSHSPAKGGAPRNDEGGTPCAGITDVVGGDVHIAPTVSAKGLEPYEEILLLRYLLEGRYVAASGGMASYKELLWGATYNDNFQGRVIGRLARRFGKAPGLLTAAVEGIPGLWHEKAGSADEGFRIEFLNGFFVDILIWAGDEEFPPAAQMLFSENFKYAFSSEDMAVVGDIVISRLCG